MTYAGPMGDILDGVDQMIRASHSRRHRSGIVVAKNPDGKTLQVKILGWGASPVQCGTVRNLWGSARVGDRVDVSTRLTPTAVGFYENRGPANTLQRVGEDFTEASTDSVDDWVTLLDVQDIVIPAENAFEVWWTTSAEAVNSASENMMQVRVLLNDTPGSALNVGLPGQSSAERAFASPYVPAAGFRMLGGQIGTFILAYPVEDITRVRLEGRTNDDAEEDDVLHAYGLSIFA